MQKLIVERRTDDWYVQLENKPETWAIGKTIEEALGNWLKKHEMELNILIEYRK